MASIVKPLQQTGPADARYLSEPFGGAEGMEMLIRITGRAEVTLDDGSPVTARATIRELDGAESDDTCANYLDSDLADLGITGGTIKLTYNAGESLFRV